MRRPLSFRKMKRRDKVIWAAGFFDGEGCVNISKTQGSLDINYHNLRLHVVQTSIEPLLILRSLWGGCIRELAPRNERWALQYNWRIYSQDAARVLAEMLPFLRVKSAQAKLALEFTELPQMKVKKRGLPRYVVDAREEIYKTMRVLNKKGPGKPMVRRQKGQNSQLRLVS